MRKTFLLYIALAISITAIAQDRNQIYCFNKQQNTVNLDFKKIDNYYERLHLLYSIGNDDRFLVSPSEENGLFYITSNDNYLNDSLLEETFVDFFNEKTEDFNSFDKSEIAEKEAVWKNGVPNLDMLSLMMDYMMENLPRSENDSCHKALPFCTDVGLYQFPAGVNAGIGESGPNYNCLSTRPNPAWYYMRIKDPGDLIITMHSEPSKDIDYCCWGPFDDPITPCPFGLGHTPNTMCSYSINDIEVLTISHAQTGQYYILVITNYSENPCNIIFSKTGGTATTDDSILPPIIEASNQCYGGTLQLSAQDVNNATYSWTGPNGFTSNVREPSIPNVTFAYSGTYTCVMTIPGQGTSDPISIDVEILPSLDADFTVEDPCSGGITKFTGTETTIPPGHNDQISTYLWNFGDGNPDVTEQNPTYRYAEPGVYTVTYTVITKNDTDGTCESTITKDILIGFGGNVDYTDTICEGEDYNKHGFHFSHLHPGIIYDTMVKPAGYGCDSTICLKLIVGNQYDISISDTICYGEPYKNHGFYLDSLEAGDTVINVQSATNYGCDSIVTLNLHVAPTYNFEVTDTICFGESYKDYGFDIKEPDVGFNTYINTFGTTLNCDSTWTLNLYVEPSYNLEFEGHICEGEDFHDLGFDTLNPPIGTHVIQKELKSLAGCDSIRILTLTVSEVYDTIIRDSICLGEDYNGNGFDIKQPPLGMTYDTLFMHSMMKCDSTVRLELLVNPVYDIKLYDTICLGEEYHGYNFDTIPTETGTFKMNKILLTTNGCDSIVTMNLTVNETFSINLHDTICFGNSYTEHGFNIENPEVGMTYDTLFNKTTSGCDSISTIELYVAPVYDTTFYDTICRGENYTHHGFKLDSLDTGWHFDTLFLSTVCDCDSTVMLELYVAPTYDTTFIDTTCFGNEYHNHGFDLNKLEVGTTFDTLFLHSLLGCDSTVMLELYVAPVYDTTFYDTISIGEDYHGHGFDTIAPLSGLCLMQHDYLTELGCDSILTVHLIVGDVYNIKLTDIVCYGESYTNYGFELDSLEVGIHHDTLFLKSILGCDSVVSLELDVVPSYLIAFTDTTCFNESYHGHGFDIDSHDLQVGMNYDTLFLLTTLGCDSITTLELYVAPLFNTDLYDTICHGEEYHQHGFDIIGATDGWNFDTLNLHSTIGCDSTVIMHLFVGKIYNPSFTDTICYGQVYAQHGFYLDSLELGFHYDTLYLQSILGCDSIATLELYVAPVYDTTFFDTICFGESYYEHGFNIENPGTGWNYSTMVLSTTLGCDSIVRLELYVAPTYGINLSDTICFGEDYHGFNFDTVNPAAGMCVMQQELTTPIGCDSIVTMNLLVGEVYDINFTDTICFGYDYHEHGFDFTNPEVGFHHDTLHLQSMLGCDSTVMLELYVAPIYDTTFFDTICFGESYYEHGFNIENPGTGWNYETMELSTTLGCDSIINIELYVAPTFTIELFDTICFSEDYHGFNFDTINPAVGLCVMQQELATLIGCDSIVTMNLLVGELYDVNINDTICYGEDYHEYGFNIEAPEVGLHYDTLHLQTVLGCDSTVMLELYTAPTYLFDYSDTICFGESYYEHGFSIENPEQGLGTHWLNFTTVSGCDSVLRLELYVAPVYNVNLYDTICHGEDYHNHGFDFILPEPGLHYGYKNLLTAIGCDSIITMNLLVGNVYDITIKDTICFGDDYHGYNFHFDNPEAGIHTDVQSLSSMHGCDSVVRLRLFVAPTYHTDVIDSICEGENYTKYGLDLIEPEPGVYDLTSSLETQYGCDSVFDVNLKVINTFVAPDTLYGLNNVFASTNLLSGKYQYSIDPITGCEEYHWELNNGKWVMYPNENECTIIVTTPEVATLTVWAGNSCGEVSKSIEIHAGYFGVDENEAVKADVYPNPAAGYVNIKTDGIEVVNILNATGVVVKSCKFEKDNLVSIDISELPNSIYVLEIVTRDGRCIRRITKTGY